MIQIPLEVVRYADRLTVSCDVCPAVFERRKRDLLKSRAVFTVDVCRSCGARLASETKPQCSAQGWDGAKRAQHGEAMKASENYYTGIKNRPSIAGEANPMFGVSASAHTREKMRASRIGKIGVKATAWKGGGTRFLTRVRKMLESRFRWYSRVIARERGICQGCGGIGNEGHHVDPVSVIVAELLKDASVVGDDAALEWLMTQDRLTDPNLLNGKCVCRPCHQLEHLNWGSHEPQTKR